MTLLEVMLGLALFTAFASSAFFALEASASSYRTETTVAHLAFLAGKAMDDVAEHLREADFDALLPAPGGVAPPASASSIDFQTANGFANGAATWGPVERLALEPEPEDATDGVDNDGDGLVDEGRLVWIENPALGGGRRTVLCSHVAAMLEGEIAGNGGDDNGNGLVDEPGFCVEFVGDRATVHITLERLDPERRRIQQSSSRTVTPRNTTEE
jgi:hypothetical protein